MEIPHQVQNLDPDERRKFDELAASWWDPEGTSKPLHQLNPARLAYIDSRCSLKGKRVLDVGCGGGLLTEAMTRKGAAVTGIDIAAGPLAVASLHLNESGLAVDYRETTVEQLAESREAPFDVITCMEMLEHVPSPDSVIRSMASLLKPGGSIFLSTISRNPLAFGLAIVGAEYIARLLPRGTHRYDRFIRPSELSAWLRGAGLQTRDIRGLHYDPLGGAVRVGGHVKVNYLLHAKSEVL